MCSMNDDPSMTDEPLEDTVDWAELRAIKRGRDAQATWWLLADLSERISHYDQTGAFNSEIEFGLPPRPGRLAIAADGARHSEARRGGLA